MSTRDISEQVKNLYDIVSILSIIPYGVDNLRLCYLEGAGNGLFPAILLHSFVANCCTFIVPNTADTAVRVSRERVRAAIRKSGYNGNPIR